MADTATDVTWPGCTPSLCGRGPDGSRERPGARLLAVAREVLRLDLRFDTDGAAAGVDDGVDVRLPDGTLAGVLRGVPMQDTSAIDRCQLQGMSIIAGLIGQELKDQRTEARRRAARRATLRQLSGGSGSSVVLQPICGLATGEPVGYEALSRFTGLAGRDGETSTVDAIFQEAHDLGLGVELELTAARAALALLPRLPSPTYLSINLSPRALLDPATAELCNATPANRLVLELTEHEQVEDYPAVGAALAELRRRGVRLAVDDAGAGFASLQHISRLNPDLIKLDRALIQGVQGDPSRRALVRAMVQFSRETGASLVAEGIEDDTEIRQLIELGVEFGQGFLLGRPATPSHWLAEQPSLITKVASGRRRHRAPAA